MLDYVQFKYNVNNFNTQSVQYGSDQNYNVCSVINMASYDLYDSNNVKVGFIQFIDNGVGTSSTKDFQNSPQLYNETGVFFVQDKGTIAYNISFVSNSTTFSTGQIPPSVISATGEYYNKIDKIAIDSFDNGDRNVWITFK